MRYEHDHLETTERFMKKGLKEFPVLTGIPSFDAAKWRMVELSEDGVYSGLADLETYILGNSKTSSPHLKLVCEVSYGLRTSTPCLLRVI